jgi:hypothetical protein
MGSPGFRKPAPPGKRWVFTRTIRTRTGKILDARAYGRECWCFLVDA